MKVDERYIKLFQIMIIQGLSLFYSITFEPQKQRPSPISHP